MSNTYTWLVTSMEAYPEYESETDVVFSVAFAVNATDGATPVAHRAIKNGVVPVSYKAGTPFTPYSQLTQAQVIGWVQDYLQPAGVASIYAGLDSIIQNQISPTIVTLPLPWATT